MKIAESTEGKIALMLSIVGRPSAPRRSPLPTIHDSSPAMVFARACTKDPALAAKVFCMDQRHVEAALRLGGFPGLAVVAWGRSTTATHRSPATGAPVEVFAFDLDSGRASYFFIHANGKAERLKSKACYARIQYLAALMRGAHPESLGINQDNLIAYIDSIEEAGASAWVAERQ